MSQLSLVSGELPVELDVYTAFSFTIDGDSSVKNPLGGADGRVFRVKCTRSNSGALTWGGSYKFAGGSAPTLGTTAGDFVDLIFALFNQIGFEVYREVFEQ